MNTDLRTSADSAANDIIALSQQLDNEIETWGDVFARVPDSTSNGVSAGFISKPDSPSHIEIVVDVQAPPAEQTGRLRIWAIETTQDDNGNERFNNVQLTYGLNYETARKLIEQPETPSRDDFAALAHDQSNQLENVVVSDLTGKDAKSEQLLGTRYDIGPAELRNMPEELRGKLTAAMQAVLERLKKSAANK